VAVVADGGGGGSGEAGETVNITGTFVVVHVPTLMVTMAL
jgi:hypothetical protein